MTDAGMGRGRQGRIGRGRIARRSDPVRRRGIRDARGDHVSYIFVSRCAECQPRGKDDEASAARTGPLAAPPEWSGAFSGLDALAGAVVRVRVIVLRVYDPPLRAASAHDAPKEHRASVARHAVVMAGHVAADPTPHKSPSLRSDDARAKGNISARCTTVLVAGINVQICALRME